MFHGSVLAHLLYNFLTIYHPGLQLHQLGGALLGNTIQVNIMTLDL